MVNILKYCLIFLCFSSCVKKDLLTFEGSISYKVNLAINNKDLPIYVREYLESKFGDTLITYYHKNGDVLRKYKGSGLNGNDYHIYKKNENSYFIKRNNSDTIYSFNANINSVNLKSKYKEINDVYILNQKCSSVVYEGFSANGNQNTKVTFFYSGKPIVNHELYKNWKDLFINDFFKTAKSPFLKYQLETDNFTLEITAIKIKKMKIEDEGFRINDSAIIKKIN